MVFEQIQVEGIASVTRHHATSFVVGSHNNQRLLRVLLVEVECHLHGIVEIKHFVEGRSRVASVASVVDGSTLNHEEEALLIIVHQRVDAHFHDLRQCKVDFSTVDSVWNFSFGIFRLHHKQFFGISPLGFAFLVAVCPSVAVGFADLVKVGAVVALRVAEIGTGKVVEARSGELATNGVAAFSACLV